MKKSFWLGVIGVSAIAWSQVNPAYAQNLIINGSFENSNVDPGPLLRQVTAGATIIDGWTVTRESIDYLGTAWIAADGTRSLDLNGSPGVGGIQQTIATIVGQQYRASFALAANPGIVDDTVTLGLGIGAAGQTGQYSFNSAGISSDNLRWQPTAWEFTATESQTTLEFYSLHLQNPFGGPALDNVAVVPLPFNLINNGSFEVSQAYPVPPNSIHQLPAGSNALNGWTVRQNPINYVGTLWQAAEGFYSLELTGNGGIEKIFETIPGRNYQVSFAMAASPGVTDEVALGISAAGQSSQFFYTPLPLANASSLLPINLNWQLMTWTFMAAEAQTTLEFFNLSDVNLLGGPTLDQIRLTFASTVPNPTSVPEPANTTGLLALGLWALASRARV